MSGLLGDAWPPWVQITLVTIFLVVGCSTTAMRGWRLVVLEVAMVAGIVRFLVEAA